MHDDKACQLRTLLREKHLIRLVGAHNGMTARLVEQGGFDGVWASGLEVSTAHAVPDANILTMKDYLDAAINMNDATLLPVVADVDTGYGNANNVIHAVQKFEFAGIAAICIEDKTFPKVNSYVPGRQHLAPISEVVGKIMAGKNAQRTENFMVFARVEALVAGHGLVEALKRARAYASAEADGIFIHSKASNADEIRAFVEAWDLETPLIVCPTSYPEMTVEEAERLEKIRFIIFANHGIRAAIKAIGATLGTLSRTGDIASMKDVFDLQGMPKLKEDEKEYVRSNLEPVRVVIPAAGQPKDPALRDMLGDRPVASLQVNGKSLLERTVGLLNQVGIQDIYVVTGHGHDKIGADGIKTIHNPNYASTHVLDSVMVAKQYLTSNLLLFYSDIVVDEHVLRQLLQCLESGEDIVLVVDSSYREMERSKLLEGDMPLIKTQRASLLGRRVLTRDRKAEVVKIGKHLEPDSADFEFIGLALFSKRGVEALRQAYEKERARYSGGPFNEAESFKAANIYDFLQRMIDGGQKVHALEIHKGWAEVHSLEDYNMVSRMLVD